MIIPPIVIILTVKIFMMLNSFRSEQSVKKVYLLFLYTTPLDSPLITVHSEVNPVDPSGLNN